MRYLSLFLLSVLATTALASGPDFDGDGVPDSMDCMPFDGTLWAPPAEAISDLRLSRSGDTATLVWSRPGELGGTIGTDRYDAFGTEDSRAFGHPTGYCVELNGTDLTAEAPRLPAPYEVASYLVRVKNSCGVGPVDTDPPPVAPRALRYLRVSSNADAGPNSLRGQFGLSADGDAICLDVTGTIELTSGNITVDKDVTIVGPGAELLTIRSDSFTTMELWEESVVSSVTLSTPGGMGIFMYTGDPTVRSVIATDSNWGINAYRGTVEDALVTGNTRGVVLTHATLASSTVSGNDTGVYIYHPQLTSPDTTITSSTISGNNTFGVDAYYCIDITIRSSAISDPMELFNCDMSMESTTLADDASLLLTGDSRVTIRSSTIAGTGDGLVVQAAAEATLQNTILAADTNCVASVERVHSDGFNLATDASCINLTMPGDSQNVDPLLGPFADNGGPTLTHALLPESPAIDAGSCPCDGADQRGLARPVENLSIPNVDNACDIGAYEEQDPCYWPNCIAECATL